MSDQASHEQRFVTYLLQIAERQDRGALAALRRSIRGRFSGAIPAHRYVVPWLPREPHAWRDDCFYLAAGLFAGHPKDWPPDEVQKSSNFGASFARLDRSSESVERRFTALLAADREQLPTRLRHAVSLLKADGIPINWVQLLRDIQHWGSKDLWVQRKWARAFWAPSVLSDRIEKKETSDVG